MNTIFNEDCLEGIKRLGDNSVKLLVTDPPYACGLMHNGNKTEYVDLAISKPFFSELAKEIKRVLKPDGEFFVFCDWRTYSFYFAVLCEYLPIKNMIVWDKISGPGTHYAFTHELIIYGAMSQIIKKGTNIWREPSFCSGAKKKDGKKVHPTQKPTDLIKRIMDCQHFFRQLF